MSIGNLSLAREAQAILDEDTLTIHGRMKSLCKIPVLLLMVLLFSCAKKQETTEKEPVEFYQVVSYEAPTHEWGILYINQEKHLRVLRKVVCEESNFRPAKEVLKENPWLTNEVYLAGATLFEDGTQIHEGPEWADLSVGEKLVPTLLSKVRPKEDYLQIMVSGEGDFCIVEGDFRGTHAQRFRILSSKVVQQ